MTSLIFAVAVVLASQTAPVPSTPPPTDEYVLIIGDRVIGTEAVTWTKTEDGEVVNGTAELTTPAGSVRFLQKLEKTAGKTVRYEVKIEGGPAGATVTARATEAGWRFSVSRDGDPAEPTTSEKAVSGPSIVLDNNLASHIDLLTRALDLAPGAKASMTAVVPQALQVFPIEVVRLDDAGGMRRYRLTMAAILIEVSARAADGALLEARVPLQNAVYRRKGWEPPKTEPVGRDPREREIVIPTPVGDLPAALMVPKADKASAAILLLSGSGPNDRDETIGPNKPLRDIAHALADRGIATLRFDKRTRAFPAKSGATLAAEYLDDAAKALEILRGSEGIDPGRVFLAGHSLGGTVAPVVAARAKDPVRGLLLLAPAVRRVDDMVIDQVKTQLRLAGVDEATATAQLAELTGALARALDPSGTATESVMGAPPAYWREIAALDVPKMLGESSLPFIVLQGEKDIQVRADLDFDLLRSKLGDAKGRATYKLLPGLNHLFMKVDGASSGAEYAIPGTVAPEVADAAASWVRAIAP